MTGRVFEYIALLQAEGPQRWIYEEMERIAQIEFQFLDEEEESDLVERLCVEMGPYHRRDRMDLLTAPVRRPNCKSLWIGSGIMYISYLLLDPHSCCDIWFFLR